MLSSLLKFSTLSLSHLSFISKTPKTLTSRLFHRPADGSGGGSSTCIVRAVEKDSEQFEIDPDEAKAALQQLDKQLQTLSRKQSKSPKIKAKDVKLTRGPTEEEGGEMPEISGSVLANTAVALLIFTLLYNALFYGVIKPSIDGPDDVSEAPRPSIATESPNAAVLQLLLSVPRDFVQLRTLDLV